MNAESPNTFPVSADEVVATMEEFFKGLDNRPVCDVLANAKARIEETGYDNWNGGQYFFTLCLELPMKVFARIEPDVQNLEKLIAEKIGKVLPDYGNMFLQNVTIRAILEKPAKFIAAKIPPVDMEHLWQPGMFRLFASHVASEKSRVSRLKTALFQLGVDSFVAHEDIEPSREWQNEIELALKSMDALVALLTPTFHESKWTDQEVGFALGRGVQVISARIGLDPYGFIGKQQGLPGKLDNPELLAGGIVDLLLKHRTSGSAMREALIIALERSRSFPGSVTISKKIEELNDLSPDHLIRIKAACEQNLKVKNAYHVPERIERIIKRFQPETLREWKF